MIRNPRAIGIASALFALSTALAGLAFDHERKLAQTGQPPVLSADAGRRAAVIRGLRVAHDAGAVPAHREPWAGAAGNPFRPVGFTPPPPVPNTAQAPPAPVVEPKPVAPPFPYQFFGRMVGIDRKTLTFFIRDGNLIPVQVNDVLENNYRIDAVSDKQIVVTYLPLNEQSTLNLPSAEE
jgi:hypothetical protein